MLSEVMPCGSVFQSFISTLADLIFVLMRLNWLLLLLCVSKIHISARDEYPGQPAGSPGGATRLAPPNIKNKESLSNETEQKVSLECEF